MRQVRCARLTRTQRWVLECLMTVHLCVRGILRRDLLRRRLVRLSGQTCSQHQGERFVAITTKGRRALGRGVVRTG